MPKILNKRSRDHILWLDLLWLTFFFLKLRVEILSFLRLTAKFLAVLLLTVNPIETFILCSSKFSSSKAKVKKKKTCISKLTLYNNSTMMLMHETHVLNLLFEVNSECLISYVVAG